MKPFEIVSDEGLEIIEHNAETILQEVGVEIRDYPSALKVFADAGASVDGTRVHFPRGMCRQIVQASAPREYIQHARNPLKSVRIGGNATVFAPNYGSPFAFDIDNGRRTRRSKTSGTSSSSRISRCTCITAVARCASRSTCRSASATSTWCCTHLRYSDKPFMGSVTAASRAQDSVDMARIGFGGDLGDRTVMTSLINASSPLVWDGTMLGSAEVYARNNQACIITPFILAGAMAPVTSAGVAAQTLAESLAGMTFTQLIRPGAPVIFGSFASSMSMQTGAPTFGTPEPAIVLYTIAALARRLGVPFRSGGSL